MLSEELTVEERLDIIENEYDIPIGENIRKDQCNKFASAVKISQIRKRLIMIYI